MNRSQQVAEAIKSGETMLDVESRFGITRGTLRGYCAQHGVSTRQTALRQSNYPAMRDEFVSGRTLQEIGDAHGVTRERVRQVLKRKFNLDSNDGGAFIRAFLNRKPDSPKYRLWEKRALASIGCSRAHYQELTGNKYRFVDVHAKRYHFQRKSAQHRDIPFTLTFPEWWAIWQDSGRYEQRSASGYVMARIGDTGGYAVGNVMICSAAQNHHDQYFSGKARKKAITIHVQPRHYADAYVPANALGMSA